LIDVLANTAAVFWTISDRRCHGEQFVTA